MNYLLDTNVVSEIQRKRPNQRVLTWIENTEPASLHISALTLGEIAKGAAKLARRDVAQATTFLRWLDAARLQFVNRVIAVDSEIAVAWGHLNAHRPLPIVDGLLAATALVHRMTLVTRNVRDVADLGLSLLNPWDA